MNKTLKFLGLFCIVFVLMDCNVSEINSEKEEVYKKYYNELFNSELPKLKLSIIKNVINRMTLEEGNDLKGYLTELFDLKIVKLSEIRTIINSMASNDERELEEYLKELFDSKLNEDDINIVAESLFIVSGYRLFPWDRVISGAENKNKYRLWAIEAGFSADEWNNLSKKQQKLVANYLNPAITNPRYFIDDLSFWPNRLYGYIKLIDEN